MCYCFAGHGMQKAGRQIILLNEFDSKTTFYKHIDVESQVRSIAEKHPNSYQIVVFAACR